MDTVLYLYIQCPLLHGQHWLPNSVAQIGVQLTKPDDNAPHYITSAGDWLVVFVGCEQNMEIYGRAHLSLKNQSCIDI